ncbi:MAG: phenylacetate--CoA ligase family protein [Planctomycetota bacterium]|jgi:phenylacetate-coenzyme A ligase PaaK-like adenylate-forming protein
MNRTLRDLLDRYPTLKKTARRLMALFPLSIRLGRGFWTWYAFFEESEGWSAGALEAYQMDRLRALLTALRESSPFYRERLSGVDIESLDTPARFREQVADLTRETFRDRLDAIRSDQTESQKGIPASTSGTTGIALQFHHGAEDAFREWAAVCHQWKRVGYAPGTSRRAEFRAVNAPGKLVEVYPEQNMIRCSVLHQKAEHLREIAREIRKHGTDFYHGYPSALFLVATAVQRDGIDFPEPKAVLLASEEVFDWQVEGIREAFPEAKVFAHYGCAERTALAGWCEHRQEYHVLPQYGLVETDPKTAEIVGTNLFNTLNGFVRYRMTDTVLEADPTPCPDCGRPYAPRWIRLGGRSEDYLFSPDKGWIPPALVTYPLKALETIRELQFHQSKRESVTIRFTSRPGGEEGKAEAERESLRTALHGLFGKGTTFHFEPVDEFERGPTGKFKWVVCELEDRPGTQGDCKR